MRALVQRVDRAQVSVSGTLVGNIDMGLVVLIGVGLGDTAEDARYVVDKVLNLRVFPNGSRQFDRSALDVRAELLLVSQFTLHAETRRGRRPSFDLAAPSEDARLLFDKTLELVKASGLRLATGRFQEHMVIELQNNGPVTVMIDSLDRLIPRKD